MNYVFRLKKGNDLKKEIYKFVNENNIEAGIVKCGVGCICEVCFRLISRTDFLHKKGNYEIVSLMGTVSKNEGHIHISVADEEGNVIGGHLKEGCIVNTTAEICIESFDNYKFDRVFDDNTGYRELIIR